MAKYTIDDIADYLTVVHHILRTDVFDKLDDIFPLWDRDKDPTGGNFEVSESQALSAIKSVMKSVNLPGYDEGDAKDGLARAANISTRGQKQDDLELMISNLDELYGFGTILRGVDDIWRQLVNYELNYEYRVVLNRFLVLRSRPDENSKAMYNQALSILPELDNILNSYQGLTEKEKEYLGDQAADQGKELDEYLQDEFMKAFSSTPLQAASNFKNTQQRIDEAFSEEFVRPDNPPAPAFPWEMRIGASRFFVPPIDVKVSQSFGVGSMGGGALRQTSAPKFNSGHSETMVQITLYFPNQESIWGLRTSDSNPSIEMNFDDIDATSDEDIDFFLSSLRGLITQFRYAPFLPIRNAYLNQAWNITGVVLQSMSLSTIENYPFCVAVTLNMMKFNHKVFLPMIDDFHQAINWGRYRQYMGRAAARMQQIYDIGFLKEEGYAFQKPDGSFETSPVLKYENEPSKALTRPTRGMWQQDGTHLQFYFPSKTPGQIYAPDDSSFRQPGEDAGNSYERNKAAWETFLSFLGIEHDAHPEAMYDAITNYSRSQTPYVSEQELLLDYLKFIGNNAQDMSLDKLDTFLSQRVDAARAAGTVKTDEDEARLREALTQMWYEQMFAGYKDTPFYQQYLENAEFKNGKFTIQEWEVPMEPLDLDKSSIFVQGVSVSLSNNFAKLQVQLHDEPTYQHIGGGDSRLDIALTVVGEDNIIRLRRMFDRIGGLARLEQAHGVLGFLGVKNQLTGLAGIKYLMPLAFEANSVPGYPRVYQVNMSFTDFDVFQQKREKLSSEQQKELIDSFGKRNPFLRIKQMWGAFNAYPDFPLTIKDKNDKVIGTLDPDFYFRAFQTIENDIVYWNEPIVDPKTGELKVDADGNIDTSKDQSNTPEAEQGIYGIFDDFVTPGSVASGEGVRYEPEIVYNMLPTGQDQSTAAQISITKGNVLNLGSQTAGEERKKLGTGDGTAASAAGLVIHDETPVEAMSNSTIPGLTAGGTIQNPYAYGSSDPNQQTEYMMRDVQYRDMNGRMVRAFPTYMLWLIDEGGRFGGVKLFDNFYGLQSVIDMSIHQSEDILGDTLVLRLSNLYSKLSTPYAGTVKNADGSTDIIITHDKEEVSPTEGLINQSLQTWHNLQSGTRDDYLVTLDNIRLKPGVRVHMRLGYGSNPNALETVFNGTITQVTAGDVVEVVAQSDAIELSQYVNTTSKKGHSGSIDGAVNTGLWLSEPRDLMVRLLSMGSSPFKEAFAHATNGMIFSESRFGIRHFGSILYEPLNDDEKRKHELRYESVAQALTQFAGSDDISTALNSVSQDQTGTGNPIADSPLSGLLGGNFSGFLGAASVRTPLIGVVQSMWTNFFRKRDYELYKRNIYPGNGLGVAQYLAGDTLDAGPIMAEAAGVSGPEATINAKSPFTQAGPTGSSDPVDSTLLAMSLAGKILPGPQDNREDPSLNQSRETGGPFGRPVENAGGTGTDEQIVNFIGSSLPIIPNAAVPGAVGGAALQGAWNLGKAVVGQGAWKNNPVLQMMGIAGNDDDLSGFDEVSFRAQTYMKTVWDLFQMCAALLPNYIVAVRPFEDRSTVFYGKPHWLYTSGVIPISTGIPKSDKTVKIEQPDAEFAALLQEVAKNANPLADLEEQNEFLGKIESANPFTSSAGTTTAPTDIDRVNQFPLEQDGAKIPHRSGKVRRGKHLPTSANVGDNGQLEPQSTWSANDGHKQRDELEEGYKWPGYSAISGYGVFGIPTPDDEQWYIAMRWPTQDWTGALGDQAERKEEAFGNIDNYKHRRVLVVNPRTKQSVVCVPCAAGPGDDVNIVAELSPDAYQVVGAQPADDIYFAFVDNSTTIGPKVTQATETDTGPEQTNGSPVTVEDNGSVTVLPGQYDTVENPTNALNAPGVNGESIARGLKAGDENYYVNSFLYGWLDWDIDNSNVYSGNAVNAEDFVSAADPTFAPKQGGKFDIVGDIARRIYDKDWNKARFEAIQDQAIRDSAGKEIFDRFESIRKEFANGSSTFGGITHEEAEGVWDQFRHEWRIRAGNDDYTEVKEAARNFLIKAGRLPVPADADKNSTWYDGPGDGTDENRALMSTKMTKIVSNFKKLLWQIPYARAWLAITTDAHTSLGNDAAEIVGSTQNPLGPLPGIPDNPVSGLGEDLTQSVFGKDGYNFKTSEVNGLWQWYLGVSSSINNVEGYTRNVDSFLTAADFADGLSVNEQIEGVSSGVESGSLWKHPEVVQAFLSYLKSHDTPGKKGKSNLEQSVEDLADAWKNSIGSLLTMIGSALSGVVGMFRLSLMEMGYGMSMIGSMQMQANILNKAFNDSIYYGTGSPGSLIWLVDNPFTREYGEPVVEVREPFQRLHFINSFQDILDNGIMENLSNVPTVITASSDGKYPVTVYFDKGAPPERQVEIGVETGLFWDNARGSGFFGFLHPFMHPIETLRSTIKSATGSSDEVLARRVGLWHLKEGLKDIYQGELTVLGRSDIRPHDLVYLSDVYERMYGIFEVEAVTHHFTNDTGFVTAITPNALVTINDPGKWVMQSWIWGMFGVQDTRNHVRHLLSVTADRTSEAAVKGLGFVDAQGNVQIDSLAESIQPTLRGGIQYTGGNAALVKDTMSHAASGYVRGTGSKYLDDSERIIGQVNGLFNSPQATLAGMIPGLSMVQDLAWDGWEWVRDNLLDQHGCYIQYLTKDGQPMDAGLSFNSGVAVGSHYTTSVLPGILGLEIETFKDGHRRITTNDLLAQLGWREIDVAGLQRNVNWWNNVWNSRVLELAGRGPDLVSMSPPEVIMVKVSEAGDMIDKDGKLQLIRQGLSGAIDGDTFVGIPENGGGEKHFRLAGVNTPELAYKHDIEYNDGNDKAFIARQFLEQRLITDVRDQGAEPWVAVRVAKNLGDPSYGPGFDKYGRTLAVVFHNVPPGTPPEERKDVLEKIAKQWPLVSWDSFMENGTAYTINWELVMAGLARVDMGGVGRNDPDRGVSQGTLIRGGG